MHTLPKIVFWESQVSRALITFQCFYIKCSALFNISVCASKHFVRLIHWVTDFLFCFAVFIHLTPTAHQTSKKRGQLSNKNGNKIKEFTNMMIKSLKIMMSWTKYIHFFEFCFPSANYFQLLTQREQVEWRQSVIIFPNERSYLWYFSGKWHKKWGKMPNFIFKPKTA